MSQPTPTAPTDEIGRLAALSEESEIARLRRQRPKVMIHTQAAFEALFAPELDDTPLDERLLVALHAAALAPSNVLAAAYRTRLEGRIETWLLEAVAQDQRDRVEEPRLRALLDFSHRLSIDPGAARREHLSALIAAGLSTAAVVAIAQLIAFVAYQARMVAGLDALRHSADKPDFERKAKLLARHPAARPAASAFTFATLGWRAWLEPLEPSAANETQLAILDESHPQARSSDYYLLLALQPEILRQRSLTYNAIMYGSGGAARAERELAAAAVSRDNGCVYCASVHAQRFEQRAKRRDVIEQLFEDPEHAGTSERERAIIHFALALTRRPDQFGAEQFAPLIKQGVSFDALLDLIQATAIFAWANRLMLTLGEPAALNA